MTAGPRSRSGGLLVSTAVVGRGSRVRYSGCRLPTFITVPASFASVPISM